MEWIITIFLAIIVGYILAEILAESDCFGIIGCIRDIIGCPGNIIKCIRYIFNPSGLKVFLRENNKFQNNDISSKNSNLIGMTVTAVEDFKGIGGYYCEGYVKANGTYWKSVCKVCKISEGDIVIVKKIENLTLEVEPAQ